MTTPSISEIQALEHAVWDALVNGDAKTDANLLADDFLGVYPSGFSDRAGHVSQLSDGPSIAQYSLSDIRLIIPGDGLALLCYRAHFTRSGKVGQPRETMFVSSLWRKSDTGWRNIFSQDTPSEKVLEQ